jgi:transcriptional regulator with GAF, ATPase, and Fis domain
MDNLISTLKEIADLLTLDSNSTVNLNPVADRIVTGLDLCRAFILLYRPHSERLVASASSGLSIADFRRLETRAESGVLREAFDSSRDSAVVSIDSISTLDFLRTEDAADSLILVPIKSAKRNIGLLCVQPRSANSGSSENVSALELIGSLI